MCNDAIKTILIFLQHYVILPVALVIVQAQTNVAVIENTAELIVLHVICKAFFTSIKHTVKPLEFVMFNFCLIHVYFLSTKLQSEQIRNKILTCFYNKNE